MKHNKWKDYLLWTLALFFVLQQAKDFMYVGVFTGFDFIQYLITPAIIVFLIGWYWRTP